MYITNKINKSTHTHTHFVMRGSKKLIVDVSWWLRFSYHLLLWKDHTSISYRRASLCGQLLSITTDPGCSPASVYRTLTRDNCYSPTSRNIFITLYHMHFYTVNTFKLLNPLCPYTVILQWCKCFLSLDKHCNIVMQSFFLLKMSNQIYLHCITQTFTDIFVYFRFL